MINMRNIRHPMAKLFLICMAITLICCNVWAKEDKQDFGTVIGIDLGKFFWNEKIEFSVH